MPAIITQSLQDALTLNAGTIANCVKLTRVDGTIMGYTTYDQDLIIDGITYVHAPGMNSTQEAQSNDMAVDNLEIQAVFANSAVRKIDILAGLYDFAQFEKFIVDYTNPSGGKLVRVAGHLGEIKLRTDQVFSAQLLSSNDVVSQNPLESTAPMCRSLFGDPLRCKKNLAGNDAFGDPITVTGTITDIPGSVLQRSLVTFQGMSGGGSSGPGMFLCSATIGFAGATSVATAASGDCSAEFRITDNLHQGVCGLSVNSVMTSINPPQINFGISWSPASVKGPGSLFAFVNGGKYNKISDYFAGIKLRVAIEGGTILRFYQNDALIYTFPTPIAPTYPLYFAVDLFAPQGGQITGATLISSQGGNGLLLTDSSRTEQFRTFPTSISDPAPITWRVFAGGKITFTSGANNGLIYQIKDWDPVNKTFILMRPLGYPAAVGDTYTAVKGCPELLTICNLEFANAINFRAEHELSGPERVLSRP